MSRLMFAHSLMLAFILAGCTRSTDAKRPRCDPARGLRCVEPTACIEGECYARCDNGEACPVGDECLVGSWGGRCWEDVAGERRVCARRSEVVALAHAIGGDWRDTSGSVLYSQTAQEAAWIADLPCISSDGGECIELCLSSKNCPSGMNCDCRLEETVKGRTLGHCVPDAAR